VRILILGGDGMLGHRLLTAWRERHEVRVTLRRDLGDYAAHGLFDTGNSYAGIDVRSFGRLVEVAADFRPEAIVNAVGIVKQRDEAKDAITSLEINALLPHRLAVLARAIGARLVHLSTDCVFSGSKGRYTEADPSDAEDLYGKTKFLGEVQDSHCITFRTSIIGRELVRKTGLLEWFLAQKGSVRGYRRAIFSGFTTTEMGRIIEDILLKHPSASGLYQVSSEPISKYALLALIKSRLKLPIDIVPDDSFVCDRSLDSARFRRDFGYTPPVWESMVDELARETRGERK
jgi:dTDP-4-dehydrorhamnose reductase